MKNLLFVFFTLLLTAASAQSQGSISGRLLDMEADLAPLTFAKVFVKEIKKTVMTDQNGDFKFTNIQPGQYTLVTSFSGYDTKEVTVNVKASVTNYIDVNLGATSLSLDDLMAVVSTNTLVKKSKLNKTHELSLNN